MNDQNDQPLAPLRIFLLDDNPGILRILRSILSSFGCTHINAYTTIEPAISALPQLRPDLVIADYELGGPTGLDFVAVVRTHDIVALRTTPVIMLTSHTTPDEVRSFVNGGVDEVMAKPVEPAALYEQIVALVNTPYRYVQVRGYFGPDRRRAYSCINILDRRRRSITPPDAPEPGSVGDA